MQNPQKSRKFWLLSSNRWYSAVTAYALNQARALTAAGHEVVFSPIFGSPGHHKALEYRLTLLPFASFGPLSFRQFKKRYDELLPDVLIAFGGPEEALFISLKCSSKKPKKLRFRGLDRDQFQIKKRFLPGVIDAVIAPNQTIKALAECNLNLPSISIPYPLPSNICEVANWKPDHRPELLLLGRFDQIKGHDRLLKFYSKLLVRWPLKEVRPILKIIGYEANLKLSDMLKLVSAHGLRVHEDVIVVGEKIEDIEAHIASATWGVISSLGSEVICRVGEEFLVHGVPLLLQKVGALPELSVYMNNRDSSDTHAIYYEELGIEATIQFMIEKLQESTAKRSIRMALARSQFGFEQHVRKLNRFLEDI